MVFLFCLSYDHGLRDGLALYCLFRREGSAYPVRGFYADLLSNDCMSQSYGFEYIHNY